MTESTLSLTVTIPDGSENLEGVSVYADSIGMSEDAVPIFILAAAEIILRGRITQELAQQNPYGTADFIHAAAALNARLAAVRAIMELPMPESEVAGGVIDLSSTD